MVALAQTRLRVRDRLYGAWLGFALAIGGCSQLLGDPWDVELGERERAAASEHEGGSGGLQSRSGAAHTFDPDAGVSTTATDEGSQRASEPDDDAGVTAEPVRELANAPRCPSSVPSKVYEFDVSLEAWTGQKVGNYGSTTAEFESAEGSPRAGSVRVKLDFPALPPDGAWGARVGTTGPAQAPSCFRARLKIDGAHPPPSDLTTEPASWYFWALSGEDWCFGQLLTETQRGWYKQLDQTDVWYELAAPISQFRSVDEAKCPFDPTQIRSFGVAIASNFREPWSIAYLVDRVELFD